LHACLQATEKGVPFMPLRGLIGTDILANRADWKVVDNPFGDEDPIVLLPAKSPDVTMIHAPLADREGNIWIGRRRELSVLVHAAKQTIVTVEGFYEGSFFDDEQLAAGALPALYIDAIAQVERGAWPLGLADRYQIDSEHMRQYAKLAKTQEGFNEYLQRYVYAAPVAA
jgi:glutaconate CoA-transferase subunit A